MCARCNLQDMLGWSGACSQSNYWCDRLHKRLGIETASWLQLGCMLVQIISCNVCLVASSLSCWIRSQIHGSRSISDSVPAQP